MRVNSTLITDLRLDLFDVNDDGFHESIVWNVPNLIVRPGSPHIFTVSHNPMKSPWP